jgi:hypothetical protein
MSLAQRRVLPPLAEAHHPHAVEHRALPLVRGVGGAERRRELREGAVVPADQDDLPLVLRGRVQLLGRIRVVVVGIGGLDLQPQGLRRRGDGFQRTVAALRWLRGDDEIRCRERVGAGVGLLEQVREGIRALLALGAEVDVGFVGSSAGFSAWRLRRIASGRTNGGVASWEHPVSKARESCRYRQLVPAYHGVGSRVPSSVNRYRNLRRNRGYPPGLGSRSPVKNGAIGAFGSGPGEL